MKVKIANQVLNLDEKDVLGSGGEALVLRYGSEAIKLYHDPTPDRAKKLQDLLRLKPSLPSQVIFPLSEVYDPKGKQIIGFSMRALADRLHPLSGLSNKNFRTLHNITFVQVAELFQQIHLTLQAIHRAGLVVGDFNDQNVLFEGSEATFIDVDSYQFAGYPCPVATEPFLAPELYGLDLTKQPYFKPENDWYSYAVLLFRALLLAHPYGGTHPQYKLLTARAANRLTVFNPEVTYPKIALNPNFISDDLANVFERFFGQGWRGMFPLAALTEYVTTLQECPTCHATYPATRKFCPACQAFIQFVLPKIKIEAGIRAEELLAASGPLVAFAIFGDKIYCVAHEENAAVLYIKEKDRAAQRLQLFKWLPGARYEFMNGYLVVNPHATSDLLVLEILPSAVKPLCKTKTDRFSGQGVFATSDRYLYRIAGGMLMRGEIKLGQLVERSLTSVLEGQTWFTVATAPDGEDVLTGFGRIFRDYEWFRFGKNGRETLAVPPLEPDDALLDFAVKDGLVLRQTRRQGVEALRLEAFDSTGKVLFQQKRILTPGEDAPYLSGTLYRAGVALWPGADGIVREQVQTRQRSELSATAPYVNPASQLALFGGSILAATDQRLWQLTLL